MTLGVETRHDGRMKLRLYMVSVMTPSMAWMTPLAAMMSGTVTSLPAVIQGHV